jgi:hypothetical protein
VAGREHDYKSQMRSILIWALSVRVSLQCDVLCLKRMPAR